MGKASRMKQQPDRRARIAAQREAQRRAAQRKRIYLAGGSILAVAIIAVAFVIFKGNGSSGASNGPTGTALAKVTSKVTGVSASVTDKIAGGGVTTNQFISQSGIAAATASGGTGSYFATVSGKALTENGKPEVLYLGAEYCPYCAAERWAMVNALSRFGTFTGLKTVHSSSTDAYPNTPTFTFYGSKYTSAYVAFTSVEETTNVPSGSGYTTLQTPTSAQSQLGQTYDSSGSIPFIDIANTYVEVGNLQPLSPSLLQGKTWAQVASALSQPSSSIAKAVIGNANYLTAGICAKTGNLPATACTPTIKSLESNLAKA
jgi:thiol-disulfide isomerase/thioredoxin